jgi:threonine dehydrogenase-like Zn-dependent dehydrogenase
MIVRTVIDSGGAHAKAGVLRSMTDNDASASPQDSALRPAGSDLHPGDWVVGIVRHPDPVPCLNCAAGEWDMCRNGRYTEHGIKGLHGFARERFRTQPEFLVKGDPGIGLLNVLVEPASVVAKAWDHVQRIGERARWLPARVLVTGAGPIGLLAALAAVQRGLEVHVLDRVTTGPKPELVRDLGARYHHGEVRGCGRDFDVVIECTGAPALFFDVIEVASRNGIVCLAGISSGGHRVTVDPGLINRELVLENNVVFGTVNANRRHYQAAARLLAAAKPGWLERLVTHRVPLPQWSMAYQKRPDAIKIVLLFD